MNDATLTRRLGVAADIALDAGHDDTSDTLTSAGARIDTQAEVVRQLRAELEWQRFALLSITSKVRSGRARIEACLNATRKALESNDDNPGVRYADDWPE